MTDEKRRDQNPRRQVFLTEAELREAVEQDTQERVTRTWRWAQDAERRDGVLAMLRRIAGHDSAIAAGFASARGDETEAGDILAKLRHHVDAAFAFVEREPAPVPMARSALLRALAVERVPGSTSSLLALLRDAISQVAVEKIVARIGTGELDRNEWLKRLLARGDIFNDELLDQGKGGVLGVPDVVTLSLASGFWPKIPSTAIETGMTASEVRDLERKRVVKALETVLGRDPH